MSIEGLTSVEGSTTMGDMAENMTKTQIKALAKDHILDKIATAVAYAEEMLASTGEPYSPAIQAEIRKQGDIAARALGFEGVPFA